LADILTFGSRPNIAAKGRFFPQQPLPGQHGRDLILKRQRRRQSRVDLVQLAARPRALRPGLAPGADPIAGFPTEAEEHLCTMNELVAEAGLTFLHVIPNSPRAGTPSARMPQPPVAPLGERIARLTKTRDAQRASFLASRRGRLGQVLREANGVGHGAHFVPVRLSGAAPGALLAGGYNGKPFWAEAA